MSKFEKFKKSLSRAFNNFAKRITPKKEVYKIEEGTRSATITTKDWLFFHQHWCSFTINEGNLPPKIVSFQHQFSIGLLMGKMMGKADVVKKKAEAFCKTGIIP